MDRATSPSRWRRYLPLRVSMRVLMGLVLVLAGGFGWLAERARLQREAVAALKRCKASVWYYGHSRPSRRPPAPEWLRRWLGDDYLGSVEEVQFSDDGPVVPPRPVVQDALAHLEDLTKLRTLVLHGESAIDAGLAHIGGLTRLEELRVDYYAYGVTDAGVAHLEGLKNLKSLALQGTRMTDAGVARLATLSRLEHLAIDQNHITDVGLAQLRRLKNLKSLWIGRAYEKVVDGDLETFRSDEITDAGLVHLAGLNNLKNLSIEGTGVTDRGLRHLEGLRKLKDLYIAGTRITIAGEQALKRAIPGLTIHRKLTWPEGLEIPPLP